MRIQSEPQDIPKWKLDLIEEARKLIAIREQNIQRRQGYQPIPTVDLIKNPTIGK